MKYRSGDKIVPVGSIESIKKLIGRQKIVLVGGCFDVFHYGHLKFLQAAKKQGDVLIIALEPDEFIVSSKKRRPVHTQYERAQILASLLIADYIFLLPHFKSDDEYARFTRTIAPHIIAVTKGDLQLKNKKIQAQSVGARLVTVTPVIKDFSTTKIIHYAA